MPKALKFFKTKDACHCCSLSRVTGDEAVSKQPTNDTFKSKLYLDVCLQSSRCGTILSLSPAPSPSPYSSFPSFSSATFSPLFFFFLSITVFTPRQFQTVSTISEVPPTTGKYQKISVLEDTKEGQLRKTN